MARYDSTIVLRLSQPIYGPILCGTKFTAYPDDKIARLTKEALAHGFNHFKIKVGADQADDLRRGKLIRSLIDDPSLLPAGTPRRDVNGADLKGKNAGPTGSVLMIDANQVWDVQQAIDYVKGLEAIKPW
jgi:L-fuconate dehydratase